MNQTLSESTPQLTGRWRITEMDEWDSDAINMVQPAFIEFSEDQLGEFGFIVVRGWLDCRPVERDGKAGVEFSWSGDDEGDETSGRGWAALIDDETVEGRIFFHMGMESGFVAKPYADTDHGNDR